MDPQPTEWELKLPAPGSPGAAKYWRDEQSGVLEGPVKRLLEGNPLSILDISLLRAYFIQWVDATAWELNPFGAGSGDTGLDTLRRDVRLILTAKQLLTWLGRAKAAGMDPL